MPVRIAWTVENKETTLFSLYKSTDKGLSYVLLAEIPALYSGPSYDRRTKEFFYDDYSGASGHIFKIIGTSPSGLSEPGFVIVPLERLETCTIFGYAYDGFGRPLAGASVVLEVWTDRSARVMKGAAQGSVVSFNDEAVMVGSGKRTVYVNEQGMWQVACAREAYVGVTIPDTGARKVIRVPNKEGPVNLQDIPQVQGSDFYTIWPGANGEPGVFR